MKNFVSTGDFISVPAPYDVTSGDGVLVGSLFGIAATTAKSGDPVEIKTTGEFNPVKKTSAQAWTVGAAIYWDNTNKVFTTASSSNALVATATAAAANPSAAGSVRLNG